MRNLRSRRGFSLLEVVVALGVLTTGVAALAQLATIAMRANANAAATTTAAPLARDRMEQLRALAWTFDANGGAISDLTTDLAATSTARSGGAGLTPSPPDALSRNTAGYCDFIDANGRSLGGGTAPPAGAVYVRRWSIAPLPAFPDSTLILQVFVTSVGSGGDAPRLPSDVRIVTIKTRKAP
jgi:prepilin-type N-terminal cleavage/methylation domain-containing protein